MQWKFKIPKVEKPNRSCFRIWRQFVAWLTNQEVTTKIEFGKHCVSKWQISNNKMTLKIMDIDRTEQCRVRNEENPRRIEFGSQIDNSEIQHWNNVLGKKHNRKFVVQRILTPEEEREEEVEINEEERDGIRNKKSHLVTDVSMLHNQIGGIGKQ